MKMENGAMPLTSISNILVTGFIELVGVLKNVFICQ